MDMKSERLLLTDTQWALLDEMRQRGPLDLEALQDAMRGRLLQPKDFDIELEGLHAMSLARGVDRRWRLTLRGHRCVASRRCVSSAGPASGSPGRGPASWASAAWVGGGVLVLLLIWLALNSQA